MFELERLQNPLLRTIQWQLLKHYSKLIKISLYPREYKMALKSVAKCMQKNHRQKTKSTQVMALYLTFTLKNYALIQ